eukprot:TRINITY_DN27846_c0_g1_i1.p1 TRINITY_DN27846_c0_g1~~TRINITY_DN27846_c0_g1_i1.p1  ORF type:complete len:149 (-),score=27.32 TRINITY_DN27846_c0_g1_i1:27-473(-)
MRHAEAYADILRTDGTFDTGVLVIRIGASLYYANASFVEDTILAYKEDMDRWSRVECVIFELSACASADSTAIERLKDLIKNLQHEHVQVMFACMSERLHSILMRSGLLKLLGEEFCFDTVHEAVLASHSSRTVKHEPIQIGSSWIGG